MLHTYLPSNYEENAVVFLQQKLEKYNLISEYTPGGDLMVQLKNSNSNKNILIDAHLDEIHLRIVNISSDGYLVAKPFGSQVELLLGKKIIVHGKKEINGVIMVPPAHFVKKKITELPELQSMIHQQYLWIDIGTQNREEADKLVSIGDAITFPTEVTILENNCIVSKGLDNRIGVFVLSQVMYILKNILNGDNITYPNIIGNFSNREETGQAVTYRDSNFNLDYIMVLDTNIDTSTPLTPSPLYSPITIGKGPVISQNLETTTKLNQDLIQLSKDLQIPHQISFNTHLGGTNLMEYRKYDTQTICLGVAIRNIHSSVETCQQQDILQLIVMVCNFLLFL